MTKPKYNKMKLELACTRKGKLPHGFKIQWTEPEDKAVETYDHFLHCLSAMLKAHGLMKESGK